MKRPSFCSDLLYEVDNLRARVPSSTIGGGLTNISWLEFSNSCNQQDVHTTSELSHSLLPPSGQSQHTVTKIEN